MILRDLCCSKTYNLKMATNLRLKAHQTPQLAHLLYFGSNGRRSVICYIGEHFVQRIVLYSHYLTVTDPQLRIASTNVSATFRFGGRPC